MSRRLPSLSIFPEKEEERIDDFPVPTRRSSFDREPSEKSLPEKLAYAYFEYGEKGEKLDEIRAEKAREELREAEEAAAREYDYVVAPDGSLDKDAYNDTLTSPVNPGPDRNYDGSSDYEISDGYIGSNLADPQGRNDPDSDELRIATEQLSDIYDSENRTVTALPGSRGDDIASAKEKEMLDELSAKKRMEELSAPSPYDDIINFTNQNLEDKGVNND